MINVALCTQGQPPSPLDLTEAGVSPLGKHQRAGGGFWARVSMSCVTCPSSLPGAWSSGLAKDVEAASGGPAPCCTPASAWPQVSPLQARGRGDILSASSRSFFCMGLWLPYPITKNWLSSRPSVGDSAVPDSLFCPQGSLSWDGTSLLPTSSPVSILKGLGPAAGSRASTIPEWATPVRGPRDQPR